MKDVSKKKLSKLSKALEAAQAVFHAEVEKLAEEARVAILPYFKKHGFDFYTGNGTWLISGIDASLDDDELPSNIRAVLDLEVAYNDYLGFYIRNIKRGEW